MKVVRPDYNDCLTNLSNSILKYFGCKTFHNTLSDVDEILLNNNSKNVVLFVLDGLGSNVLDKTLSENSFLRKNKIRDIHSVFPSTTTAATTSLLSGLNPCEHGWLGWTLYFSKVKKIVTMFTNKIKDTDTLASEENLAEKYYNYTSIIDMINQKYEAYKLSMNGKDACINLNDICTKLENLCKENGKKFIYVHYPDPDDTLHQYGTEGRESKLVIKNINSKMEALCNKLEDTTIIFVADHGHIDSKPITIKNDHPEFFNMLKNDVSIDVRATNFFIKSHQNDNFEDYFADNFERDFILYSKKQVIAKKIFGDGKEHKLFKDSLGDYLAIGIGDKFFRYDDESTNFKSMHSGMTEDEMYVPLIIVTKK